MSNPTFHTRCATSPAADRAQAEPLPAADTRKGTAITAGVVAGGAFLALFVVFGALAGGAIDGAGASEALGAGAGEATRTPWPAAFGDRSVRMCLAGMCYALWGTLSYLRCLDPGNRRRLVLVTALVCAWMLLVVVKWNVRGDRVATTLWHCYYIPMTLLPLLCLGFACRSAGVDRRPGFARTRRALWVVATALIALVLTNDVHHWVFVAEGYSRGALGAYAYGWGYWLVVGWSAGCYLAFFIVLAHAARRRLKIFLLPVAILCLAGFCYALAYASRLPAATNLNVSLVYSLIVVASLELCVEFGFIPSTRTFTRAFEELPLSLTIASRRGEVVYATRHARPLPRDVVKRLSSVAREPRQGRLARRGAARARDAGKPEALEPRDFSSPSRPGRLFRAWPLSAGVAVLDQDVTELEAARATLVARKRQLMRTNKALEHRHQVDALLARIGAEQHLVDDVEHALNSSFADIAELLEGLPASGGAKQEELRVRTLKRVRMIVAYCKRKGGLVVAEAGDPELERERMALIVNELAGDMRAVGIDCAATVSLTRPIPAREMSVLYDCVYAMAFLAFACSRPALIYHLGEKPLAVAGEDAATPAPRTAELRAILQSDDEADLATSEQTRKLTALLDERPVLYTLSGGPGVLRIVVQVRQRGDVDV